MQHARDGECDSGSDADETVCNESCKYFELFRCSKTLNSSRPAPLKRERAGFQPLFGEQDMGKRLRVTMKNGQFVKEEVFGIDNSTHASQWASSKRRKAEPAAAESGRVYQGSWPDEAEKPSVASKKSTKRKEEPKPEKFPGTYYNPKDSTWYMLSEDKRRRPVEGRSFWHPTLRRAVRFDGQSFIDDDGSVIPELEGVGKAGPSAPAQPAETTLETLQHAEEFGAEEEDD